MCVPVCQSIACTNLKILKVCSYNPTQTNPLPPLLPSLSSLIPGKQLHLVHSQVKPGSVYQVVPFSSNKLAISVNHAVCVLTWNEDQSVLEEECNYQNNILSLFLKTKGDFILVCRSHIVSSFTQYHTVERLCKGYLRTNNCTGTCMYYVKVINGENHQGCRSIWTCAFFIFIGVTCIIMPVIDLSISRSIACVF